MSGSGGYFSGKYTAKRLWDMVRESEKGCRDDNFETLVSGELTRVLAGFNSRDPDEIQSHLEAMLKAIAADIDGTISMLFGGSVAKHTYVDGLSDVDAVIILNKSELEDKSPAEVIRYFAGQLGNRLPKTPIEPGNLAVTVTYQDAIIQLLPALRAGSGLRIPSAEGKFWSPIIRPDVFARILTDVNRTQAGKVVPTIKLAKNIIAGFPEQQRLTGYHVESLAVKVFRGYSGLKTPKAMLTYFFEESSKHVRKPIGDSTGQSFHVDDYLGAPNSLRRKIAADALGRVSRRIRDADNAHSVDLWKEILEE